MITNRFNLEKTYEISMMQEKGTFCDVTLIANNEKIQAHKIILSSASDYFKAMLSNNFKESSMTEITIYGIDALTLKQLIKYIYTGDLQISESNVEVLLMKADYLQITSVVKLCELFLLKKLSIYNCVKMYNFTKEFNRYEIAKTILQFIIENIMDVITDPMFKTLTFNDMYNILKSDDLNINDEDMAAIILTKWLTETSNICTKKLLNCIRIQLLSKYAIQILQQHICINENLECVKILSSSIQNIEQIPRINTLESVIALGTKKFSLLKVPITSPITKKWSVESFLPVHRQKFSVAILDSNIYIAGGIVNGSPKASVLCYDTINKLWKNVTSLSSPRYCASMVVYKNRLVIIGGKTNYHHFLDNVESWRPGKNSWSKLPSLNEPCCDIASVVVDNKIYNIGGLIQRKNKYNVKIRSTNVVETLTKYGWISCSSLPEPRSAMSIITYENYIYATGGYITGLCGSKSFFKSLIFYKYDIITNSWSVIAPAIKSAYTPSHGMEKKLFIVGGFPYCNYSKTVEKYNVNKNEWQNILSNFV
ncbi:BTB kelch-domain protein [Eptesipox virus]|uniref:BTB kelch-domain protein n=1 Tax=Eptesipox virus TaxID=1329402 RepID=A0A220T6M4_9POXV|nr:BTB kelch-domain protein [Eptesipox virus]ASK51356.1 BTB kelch-domain protein [Eptesipox virus]WAH71114.1 BTB kelch-domain protein [Eptesipox virus]